MSSVISVTLFSGRRPLELSWTEPGASGGEHGVYVFNPWGVKSGVSGEF